MHHGRVVDEILQAVAAGRNDCQIARELGVPRSTVRDIRHRAARRPLRRATCPRCWRVSRLDRINAGEYTELLGLYLGDGCISSAARTQRLRLSLDSKYPLIVEESESILAHVFAANRVGRVRLDGGSTTVLSVYSQHASCLFPQHGRGKKHLREIRLEPWQTQLVELEPWPFIRGLIRSDGCCFLNRTGRYEYRAYSFENLSDDIMRLCSWALDLVGVEHRWTPGQIRVNRRASVALMLEHVGLKE